MRRDVHSRDRPSTEEGFSVRAMRRLSGANRFLLVQFVITAVPVMRITSLRKAPPIVDYAPFHRRIEYEIGITDGMSDYGFLEIVRVMINRPAKNSEFGISIPTMPIDDGGDVLAVDAVS